jgi:hypothetical protein
MSDINKRKAASIISPRMARRGAMPDECRAFEANDAGEATGSFKGTMPTSGKMTLAEWQNVGYAPAIIDIGNGVSFEADSWIDGKELLINCLFPDGRDRFLPIPVFIEALAKSKNVTITVKKI